MSLLFLTNTLNWIAPFLSQLFCNSSFKHANYWKKHRLSGRKSSWQPNWNKQGSIGSQDAWQCFFTWSPFSSYRVGSGWKFETLFHFWFRPLFLLPIIPLALLLLPHLSASNPVRPWYPFRFHPVWVVVDPYCVQDGESSKPFRCFRP